MEVYEGGQNQKQQIPPGLITKVIAGVVILVIILIGFTMFYTVEEQENAAILTFGEYTHTEVEPGLKFKLPYPIQQVEKVPANLTQQITIGYQEVRGEIVVNESEALMITGDENLVHADAVVEWRIGDVQKFLFNISDPETFLRNASIAAIRSVIGANTLDYAITDGKTEIQGLVTEKLIELQDKYESGISILEVKFQDIEPPQGEVQTAFKKVTDAREEKNTKINVAQQYLNQRLPIARGDAQALIENAEGEKQRRILNAQGDVAQFNALYQAYVNNPQVTESRLIIETLEKVLPNSKIILTNDQGETVNYLPLNELMRSSTGTNSSGSNRSTTGSTGNGSSSSNNSSIDSGNGSSSTQGGAR